MNLRILEQIAETARLDDDNLNRTKAVEKLLQEFDLSRKIRPILYVLKYGRHEGTIEKLEQGLSERGITVIEEKTFFSPIHNLSTDTNCYVIKEDSSNLSYVVFSYYEKLSRYKYKVKIPTNVDGNEKEIVTKKVKELPSIEQKVDDLESHIRDILNNPFIKQGGQIRIPNRQGIRSYVLGELSLPKIDYYRYPGTNNQDGIPLTGACEYIRNLFKNLPRLQIRFANYRDIVTRNITIEYKKDGLFSNQS